MPKTRWISTDRPAQEKRLKQLVEDFQNEPNEDKAKRIWKEIEKEVFGVEYKD